MAPLRTILHPTDFSEPSAYALGLAIALTRDHGARLIILHVADKSTPGYAGDGAEPSLVPPDPARLRTAAQQRLDSLQVPHRYLRVERRLEQREAAAEILQVARDAHADLIVMGTHGQTGLKRLLMGGVAEQVVRRAACPVLTVKMPFAAPGPA